MHRGNLARPGFDPTANDKEGRFPSDAAEVAYALTRAGCDCRLAGPEHVSLFRDGVEVARLPFGATVRAATLRAILRSLGVSAEQLAQYLLNQTAGSDP